MKYTLWFLNTHEWNSWKMLWRETLKTVKNVTSEEWSGIGGGSRRTIISCVFELFTELGSL